MLLAVNGFCSASQVRQWKTSLEFAADGRFRRLSLPLINALPPDQSQPFVDKRFRPLAMSPPSDAKLLFVPGSRNGVLMSRNFTPENTERAPCVEIRSHDQNSFLTSAREASSYISRLIPG